jgi:hypothetical protein
VIKQWIDVADVLEVGVDIDAAVGKQQLVPEGVGFLCRRRGCVG